MLAWLMNEELEGTRKEAFKGLTYNIVACGPVSKK
jgi:hypothetical protein